MLVFCADSVSNSQKERDLEIPFELPSLLGLDAFPPFLKTYMEEKEKEKDQNYHNREQSKKMDETEEQQTTRLGYEGAFRIKLQGPPTVVKLLKDCVALCKGLSGITVADTIKSRFTYLFYRSFI